MYHFQYVTKKEAAPYRKVIEDILFEVQDLVRDKFTFSFTFIGSSARNMITYDPTTKVGFDFDVNVHPNDENNKYSAKEIKQILMSALDRVAPRYGFGYAENSTRVITFKKIDPWTRAILHSCDVCIVHDYIGRNGEECQEYIRFRKSVGDYLWQDQPKGYNLAPKIEWIKKNGLLDEVLELYLYKKNNNTNRDKKSRALFAETINEIYMQNQ